MSYKLLDGFILASILLFSLLISNSVFACENKHCENAYIAETKQEIVNQIRRANAEKSERHAYSMNRERRAYALLREKRAYAEFVHKYFVLVKSPV